MVVNGGTYESASFSWDICTTDTTVLVSQEFCWGVPTFLDNCLPRICDGDLLWKLMEVLIFPAFFFSALATLVLVSLGSLPTLVPRRFPFWQDWCIVDGWLVGIDRLTYYTGLAHLLPICRVRGCLWRQIPGKAILQKNFSLLDCRTSCTLYKSKPGQTLTYCLFNKGDAVFHTLCTSTLVDALEQKYGKSAMSIAKRWENYSKLWVTWNHTWDQLSEPCPKGSRRWERFENCRRMSKTLDTWWQFFDVFWYVDPHSAL